MNGPGVVASKPDWKAREVGFWPPQAESHPPVWSVEYTGGTVRVCPLHETSTGKLVQALGDWGRVVPAGNL